MQDISQNIGENLPIYMIFALLVFNKAADIIGGRNKIPMETLLERNTVALEAIKEIAKKNREDTGLVLDISKQIKNDTTEIREQQSRVAMANIQRTNGFM